LKAALAVCVDGDIISLSADVHLVVESLLLDANIALTIQGAGKGKTTLQLSDGVLIDLYQVNLELLDLTVSGGLGISVNAMAQVLDILNINLDVSLDLNVHLARVKFEDCVGGLKLYAPDPDLFGSFGSITALVEACVFIGLHDEVAIAVGTRVDLTLSLCEFTSNLNGVLRIFGDNNNNQCPSVTIDACVFVGNKAGNLLGLIVAGTIDCNDLIVFVGLNVFENNVAKVLLGFLDSALGWNLLCNDCDFNFSKNKITSKCGTLCPSGDNSCTSPPSFLSADVDICVAGIQIDLDIDLPIILPALPIPIVPVLPIQL